MKINNRNLMRIIGGVTTAGVLSGCMSLVAGVDPWRAAPNMGYVDFFSTTCDRVWEISETAWSSSGLGAHTWPGSTIRLERPTGPHRFVVSIRRGESSSSFPTEWAVTVVQVTEGMVFPVDVLCPVTGQVPTSYANLINMSPSGWATYETGTKPGDLYTVELVAKPPRTFARKKDMNYIADRTTSDTAKLPSARSATEQSGTHSSTATP